MLAKRAQIKTDATPNRPRVVAISSGKGGVGKSSITINLAISLARGGARVCVLDADTGLANANILLGLTPAYSLEHVLFGAKDIEEIMLSGPYGMKIIPGANGISECVSLQERQQLRLTKELARIENDFDYILVDTAAGIADTTLDFVLAAQHVLVVITPEPTSLTDAFSLVKLLKRRRAKVCHHVVVNMCRNEGQAKDVYNRFSSAVKKYVGQEINYLGFIPDSENIRAAVIAQQPVAVTHSGDASGRSFLRLAASLGRVTDGAAEKPSFSAYWQRQYALKRSVSSDRSAQTQLKVASNNTVEILPGGSDLENLRARLISLIEHGDQAATKSLLRDVCDAYRLQFKESALEPIAIIENLISAGESEMVLSDIATLVKPWVRTVGLPFDEVESKPAPNIESEVNKRGAGTAGKRVVADDDNTINSDESRRDLNVVDVAVLTGLPVVERIPCRSHQFDFERFGSQENLLRMIQSEKAREGSLSAFIAALL